LKRAQRKQLFYFLRVSFVEQFVADVKEQQVKVDAAKQASPEKGATSPKRNKSKRKSILVRPQA
jgi:hypothetical protein